MKLRFRASRDDHDTKMPPGAGVDLADGKGAVTKQAHLCKHKKSTFPIASSVPACGKDIDQLHPARLRQA